MGKRAQMKKMKKMSQYNVTPRDVSAETFTVSDEAKKIIMRAALILILIIGVALRISNPAVISRSPDEGFYTLYAQQVAQAGIQATANQVKEYNLTSKLWVYPTPIRVGYIYPVATFMRITNIMDVKAGAYVSCIFSIIALIVLAMIGIRFFNPWVTACALLLMAASPLDLAIARRTWQDGVVGCFGLLLVYFCCEISKNPRRMIWYVLFCIFAAYFLLIKESAVVMYGLCVIWIMAILIIKEKALIKSVFFGLASIGVAGLGIAILAKVSGGLAPIAELVKNNMGSVATNQYALEYQTGSWHYYLQGFWLTSPIGTILSIVGICATIVFNQKTFNAVFGVSIENRNVLLGVIFCMISFLIIATIPEHLKNMRYISVVFGPFYLMGGLGFWYIVSFIMKMVPRSAVVVVGVIAGMVLIASVAGDYHRFTWFFVQGQIPDLVNRQLIEYSQLVLPK